MEEILNMIQSTFRATGYPLTTVRIWNDVRIYVNLTSKLSFSYDLSQNYKISSTELLPSRAFIVARRLSKEIDLIENV